MYLIKRYTDPVDVLTLPQTPRPFGPSFNEEQTKQADSYEIWGSSFHKNKEDDFCEFRLLKKDKIIFTKRVDGF